MRTRPRRSPRRRPTRRNSSHAFTVLGTTQDVTSCDCCGRDDLKKTVVLGVLDDDGSVLSETYYGAACAAKALGRTGHLAGAKTMRAAEALDHRIVSVVFGSWSVTKRGREVTYYNRVHGRAFAPSEMRPLLLDNIHAALATEERRQTENRRIARRR